MQRLAYILITLTSFSLYWETSKILIENEKTELFGADSNIYLDIASGIVSDQAAMFHPLTVYLSQAWMMIFSPLLPVIGIDNLSSAMYALLGAVGVAGAYAAFRRLLPSEYVISSTLAYALALGWWYFSSIHETKIIDGAIATLYIAIYLKLREKWSLQSALALTVILIAGCFNSIVTASLVAIPVIDVYLRERYNLWKLKWIVLHALPVPLIYFLLEYAMKHEPVASGANAAEAKGHVELMLTFAALGEHSISSFFGFLLNWFAFSLAAPAVEATYGYPIWENYYAYFEPNLLTYFNNPATALFIVLMAVMIFAPIFAPAKNGKQNLLMPLLLGLVVYLCVRFILFFIFIPSESFLYSAPIILAHLILLSVWFLYSQIPFKNQIYHLFIATLFISNMRFLFS